MGNQEPQNQKFNPNFNIAQHNQKMAQIRGQYNNQNLPQGAYFSNRPTNQSMSCHEITRNVYIIKPTIQIHINNSSVNIQFQYHSPSVCNLNMAIGVRKVIQHQQTKQTIDVDCDKKLSEILQPGDKVKFNKSYNLNPNQLKNILKLGLMMRIFYESEASEYTLTYIANVKLWKVCVEIYTKDGRIFGIEDIYGGGQQGQDCIICFCEKAGTMVKPCNHLCLCSQCAKIVQTQSNNCPICRKKIQALITLTKDN